ncbi:MAG: BMC domain-containing protein [Clostridiales bacterium]|nr:BMC domain-containing protein [Clostridiales bacterium]
MQVTALGMIETIGLVSALEAADAGLKAADVHLLGTDYVRGGLVMVRFEGDVAAVKAAVDAGSMAAQRVGHVFSSHVIPRAMPEVFCMLASDVHQGPGRRAQGGCAACGGCEGGRRESAAAKVLPQAQTPAAHPAQHAAPYHQWKVVKLRTYARSLKGISLSPNDIRYANKQTLLEAIKRHMTKEE